MSHSHDRSHDHSRANLEELCTIGVTVLLGLVAVSLGSNENPYVFWSGLTILGLAACRSIFLVFSIANHGNHRREPVAIPWRSFVLIFPVLLFFIGPSITSAKSSHSLSDQRHDVIHMTLDDLKTWAKDELKREWSEGRTGVVEGDLLGNKSGRAFILGDPKFMDDKPPFRVIVVFEQEVADVNLGRVQVTGQIQYRKDNVVLKVRSRDDIIRIDRIERLDGP